MANAICNMRIDLEKKWKCSSMLISPDFSHMNVTVYFDSINTVVTESEDGNMVPILVYSFLPIVQRPCMTFHGGC